MSDKKLIILDLDETLIHATSKPFDDNWHFEVFGYKIYKRPYLGVFLNDLRENYDVAVWSSASDDYVEEIVRAIFPMGYPLQFVWGRSRCTYKPNYDKFNELGYVDPYTHFNYLKKLEKIKGWSTLRERTLIIDDTPEKSKNNYGNAIYTEEFTGDANDSELLLLIKYLSSIKDVQNVRTIEKRFWRNSVS